MKKSVFLSWALIAALLVPLWGCGDGDDDDDDGDQAVVEGQFVGSDACQECHPSYYEDFIVSGHNFKINKVVDAQVPQYPFSSIDGKLELISDSGEEQLLNSRDDDDGFVEGNGEETDNQLGTPESYADISFVIGGYGWKARWMDLDGFIVTGDGVQYNLPNELSTSGDAFSAYHNDETNKPFNCGNCHTTGWRHIDPELQPDRQEDRNGIDGLWALEGIQCESCHGAGSAHVADPSADNIVRVAQARTTEDFLAADMAFNKAVACSECHTRDGEKDYPSYVSGFNKAFPESDIMEGGRIAAKGGLGRHHEQYDEMLGIDPATGEPQGAKLMAGLVCHDCHDPHKTTIYQDETGEAGVTVECTDCHNVGFTVATHENVADCEDCHMARLAKSAIKTDGGGFGASGEIYGDIRSHIFKIDLSKDSETEQFTEDGKFVNPWITAKFACGICHDATTDDLQNHLDTLNAENGGMIHN